MGIVTSGPMPLVLMYGDHAPAPPRRAHQPTAPTGPDEARPAPHPRISCIPISGVLGLSRADDWVILGTKDSVARPEGPVQGGHEQGIAVGTQDATLTYKPVT